MKAVYITLILLVICMVLMVATHMPIFSKIFVGLMIAFCTAITYAMRKDIKDFVNFLKNLKNEN